MMQNPDAPTPSHSLLQHFRFRDLVPLSVSSVSPIFSVAATGGILAAQAGWWSFVAIALCAVPFLISAFVFRVLNAHMPHAGASYHWSARVIGRSVARYQAWILILAYFASLPPIAIPAASYTLALLAPHFQAPAIVEMGVVLFWMVFAAVPLLLGASLTANVTRVFFVLEVVSLVVFGGLGVARWPQLHVPLHFGPFPFAGVLIAAVVVATILDGWEITAYASEESRRPRTDPGTGGLVGIAIATLFYAVLFPLLMGEVPPHALMGATDPLAVWASRLLPGGAWLVLIPILGSTAGGLWLTTFILSRILFAQGRERLLPASFARVNRRGVPYVAVLVPLAAALGIVALQLLVTSLSAFFSLVLGAAGFFLLAEFFLDSLTAAIFLTVGHRSAAGVTLQPSEHRVLRLAALASALMLAGLLAAFFVYGPKAIGNGIDQIVGILLAAGLVFAWWTAGRGRHIVIFEGHDIPEGATAAESAVVG